MSVFSIVLAVLGVARPLARPDDDVRLVEAALAGSTGAAMRLVRRLGPAIRGRLNALLKGRSLDGADLDDLTAEVWARLLDSDGARLRGFDPEKGRSLESYAALIAEQHLLSTQRSVRALKRGGGLAPVAMDEVGELPGAVSTPEAQVIARRDGDRLWRHLEASLPTRGRLILKVIYLDGQSPQEAASGLGVNLQVVYNWQHRIRVLAEEWERTSTP